MNFRIFCWWVLLLCLPFGGWAQENNDPTPTIGNTEKTIQYDRASHLEPVLLSKEKIEKFRQEKAFDYSRNKVEENWWTAFKNWVSHHWNKFWDNLIKLSPAGSWIRGVIIFLKYALILALVGLVIWLFIKLNPGSALLKPKKLSEVMLSEDEEIIERKDIPKLIAKAQKAGNYRLAIRFYYLWILKLLRDHELIDYQAQKTNQEYEKELKDPKLIGSFSELTYLYDFVWYGEFEVEKNEYDHLQKRFVQMENHLKNKAHV